MAKFFNNSFYCHCYLWRFIENTLLAVFLTVIVDRPFLKCEVLQHAFQWILFWEYQNVGS